MPFSIAVTPQVWVGNLQPDGGFASVLWTNVLTDEAAAEAVAFLKKDRLNVALVGDGDAAERLLVALGASPDHAALQVRTAVTPPKATTGSIHRSGVASLSDIHMQY